MTFHEDVNLGDTIQPTVLPHTAVRSQPVKHPAGFWKLCEVLQAPIAKCENQGLKQLWVPPLISDREKLMNFLCYKGHSFNNCILGTFVPALIKLLVGKLDIAILLFIIIASTGWIINAVKPIEKRAPDPGGLVGGSSLSAKIEGC